MNHNTPHFEWSPTTETVRNDDVDEEVGPVGEEDRHVLDTNHPLYQLSTTLHEIGMTQGQFSDISVIAFNQAFPLHRIILAANPYFKAILLHGQWSEGITRQIHLTLDDPWMSLDAFRLVIARMYGRLSDTDLRQAHYQSHPTHVLSVLVTALYFGDTPLCRECMDYITAHLSPANVVPYLVFADTAWYGEYSKLIVEECFTFLCREGWKNSHLFMCGELPLKWVAKVVAADCFYVPCEFDRYQFITRILTARGEVKSAFHRRHPNSSRSLHVVQEAMDGVTLDHVVPDGKKDSTISSECDALVPCADQKEMSRNDQEQQETFDEASILSRAVLYPQILFPHLKQVQHDALLDRAALSDALWNQRELEHLIITAKDTPVLDIPYMSTAEGVAVSFMPHDDTDKIDDQTLSRELALPTYPHEACVFKPFRFAAEFQGIAALPRGVKLFSPMRFYAGSYWQVYVQKIEDSNQLPKLGIYLQRLAVDHVKVIDSSNDNQVNDEHDNATGTTTSDMASYKDPRTFVRTGFKLYCMLPRKCFILESKPDEFKTQQSWGWRSNKIFSSAALADAPLKICIVMGNI